MGIIMATIMGIIMATIMAIKIPSIMVIKIPDIKGFIYRWFRVRYFCVVLHFYSEIYSVWIKTQYKFNSNTIVRNSSTMRKRPATQYHNKMQYGSLMNGNFMTIIILQNQKFHHTDV